MNAASPLLWLCAALLILFPSFASAAFVSNILCSLGLYTHCDNGTDDPVPLVYFARLNPSQNQHITCDNSTGSGYAILSWVVNNSDTTVASSLCIRMSHVIDDDNDSVASSGGDNNTTTTTITTNSIHGPAKMGHKAPIVFALPSGSVVRTCFPSITTEQFGWLINGLLYINVQTNNTGCKDGEIRGQIFAIRNQTTTKSNTNTTTVFRFFFRDKR